MDPNTYVPPIETLAPLVPMEPIEKLPRQIQVLGEGGPELVNEFDFEDWLAENQNERPPGSGPDGDWTVDDEIAAMGTYAEAVKLAAEDETGEMQQRLDEYPYDVMADMLHDQEYDFSPEGAEARQQRANELLNQTLDDYGTDEFIQENFQPAFPDEEDDRLFSPDEIKEKLSAYQQSQNRTQDAARKAFKAFKTVPKYPYDEWEAAIEKQFVDAARENEPYEQLKYVQDQVASETPDYRPILDEIGEAARSGQELRKRSQRRRPQSGPLTPDTPTE